MRSIAGIDGHVVVAREDRGEDDRRVRRLRRQAPTMARTPRAISVDLRRHRQAALPTLFVPAEQHDHLRVDAVELAVLEPPEDVLVRSAPQPKSAAFQP